MRHLRLVVDNKRTAPDAEMRGATGLRLLEEVTRARRVIESVSGPSREALDIDIAKMRALSLRVIGLLVDPRNK